MGEHGDSEVALWSHAHAGGMALSRWTEWNERTQADIIAKVRGAAYEIIRRKGATNHAIGPRDRGAAQVHPARRGTRAHALAHAARRARLQDVALSLPCIVGAAGAVRVLEPDMNADERAALARSAEVLRKAAADLEG